jgi:hypothetical protein
MRIPFTPSAAIIACLACDAAPASAQSVAITPIGGYRLGADFFELVTNQPVDVDGAPAVGLVVDVPLGDGLHVEALFSHQEARVTVPPRSFGPSTRWRVRVDHWQGGGRQEFDFGRARPFLTGLLGLTHYAAEGDDEIRFTVSAGGGITVMPTRHVGLRLDGRLFATFLDAEAQAFACTPGVCLVGIHAEVVWQTEFTAGLVVTLGR